MKDNEIKIPPFVQDYIDKLDGKGFSDFIKVLAEYQKEKEDYPGKYAAQAIHLNEHNRRTGQNRQLSYEDGVNRIDTDLRKKAYQTAKQHGYTGPDPFLPADKDFTRQGAKFQGMIDHVRQRPQQQTHQPDQEQEAVQDHEKKNIEALREQQPYQQDPPKVEFKGVEQEQPSGTDQQSVTDQQKRAAFLEQIKKTREQQTQRHQDKQPEV